VSSAILRHAARVLTPAIVVLAVFFLLRGHDDPGGGFIAGLVLGAGIVFRWLAFGSEGIGRLLPASPTVLLASGLGLAVVTGLAPMAFGEPFLKGEIWKAELWGGELKVTSSLVFDVGVSLVVVGMVGAFVRALGEER
jgi:multisubunit Na+/H+ antiporter MnhB subunit